MKRNTGSERMKKGTEDILDILLSEEDNKKYISGERIGNELGLTRAAVWKSLKKLGEAGFIIDSVPSKGYRLLSSPDILLPPLVRKKLDTVYFGHDYHYYGETNSTNVTAKSLASDLMDGGIVVSGRQRQGKGRLARKWESPHGGIYMSLFLKPDIPPQDVSRITLVMGEAIARYLEELTGIRSMIKWPNDIFLNGKKICGILTWMDGDMDRINWVIVGIGLNVNIAGEYFIEKDLPDATSLLALTGVDFSRVEVITQLLSALEKNYVDFISGGFDAILAEIKGRDILLGKEVVVTDPVNRATGIARGIDDEGRLIFEDERGKTIYVMSGEVTLQKNGSTGNDR